MQFGRVLDATLMMDKDTGRPRGFGFVTFDSEAAVDSTLAQPLEIHGKMIEVKKAQPRGNLQKEEEERKFGRQKGGFQGNNNNQGNFSNDQGNQPGQASSGNNNMSPAMMAQYWQRMQQYFQLMQQNMATSIAQQQNTANMGGMGGMNQITPQMMLAMQQQAQNQQRGGTPNPQSPTSGQAGMGQMSPQMMQQMMQQGGMGGGFAPGNGGMVSPMNGGPGVRPGFTAQEQLAFEQQKYERQQAQRMTQGGYGGGSGGPTSWEGMYDDVPQPNFPNQGGRGNAGGGYGGRQNSPYQGGGGRGNRGQNTTPQPSGGNSAAPANAPTGPKNAGKPGANYRGGGMRGGHRGFHPYARG